ncbi:MAG TPA: NADH oxidase, partial [Quisquiliibacterium sp.]|nr:NADH oxidase [Quisquiliibacterium sp.]
MSTPIPDTALQLRSLIRSNGELELSLASVPVPVPGPEEVLVRLEATPINPSDLGLLFGAADMSTAVQSGTRDRPIVTARVPDAQMRGMKGRLDEPMPVGNEGAGV